MLEQTSYDLSGEESQPLEIDIKPLKKFKRILSYFSDAFLQFILCFFLFNVAAVPLGKLMTGFDAKNEGYVQSSQDVRDILLGSKILFLRYQGDAFNYDDNLAYTYDVWLSYYAVGQEESLDNLHPQYGHKEENEVIRHYFVDIRANESDYLTRFAEVDPGTYFVKDGSSFALTPAVYEAVHPYFDPLDQISEDGKKVYGEIRDKVFANLYAQVMYDVNEHDLVYQGKSYNQAMKTIAAVEEYQKGLLTYSLLIAYFLSWGVYFLLIPLLSKRRKTFSMLFMRVERIDIRSLSLCRRSQAVLFGLYSAFTCFWPSFFLPISYIGFNALFGMTSILVLSLLSLALMITTIIFVLASAFNRSLEDKLSLSAMLEGDELDKIYRAKGYQV